MKLPLSSLRGGSKVLLSSISELPQLQTSILWTHELNIPSDGWLKASLTRAAFLQGIGFVSFYCHIQGADKHKHWCIKPPWAAHDCHEGSPRSVVRNPKEICAASQEMLFTFWPAKQSIMYGWVGQWINPDLGRITNPTMLRIFSVMLPYTGIYTEELQWQKA